MKRKIIKLVSILCGVILIGFIAYVFWYRLSFGVLNPFEMPDRVELFNRRYYISDSSPTDTVKNPETLQIVHWPENKTFKKIYMVTSYTGTCPSSIYILTRSGKYQCYSLSGSN